MKPAKKPNLAMALVGWAGLSVLISRLSLPEADALGAVRSVFGPLSDAHAFWVLSACIAAFAVMLGAIAAFAGAKPDGKQRWWVYSLCGAPLGAALAWSHDPVARIVSLIPPGAVIGPFETAGLILGVLITLFGLMALVGSLRLHADKELVATEGLSGADVRMLIPAVVCWLAEGPLLVALTIAHMRALGEGAAPDLVLGGVIVGLVALDLVSQAFTWRSMDEFMRQVWAESIAISLILSLALAALALAGQAAGLISAPSLYAALVTFYAVYLIVALAWAAVRMPHAFMPERKEAAAE